MLHKLFGKLDYWLAVISLALTAFIRNTEKWHNERMAKQLEHLHELDERGNTLMSWWMAKVARLEAEGKFCRMMTVGKRRLDIAIKLTMWPTLLAGELVEKLAWLLQKLAMFREHMSPSSRIDAVEHNENCNSKGCQATNECPMYQVAKRMMALDELVDSGSWWQYAKGQRSLRKAQHELDEARAHSLPADGDLQALLQGLLGQ